MVLIHVKDTSEGDQGVHRQTLPPSNIGPECEGRMLSKGEMEKDGRGRPCRFVATPRPVSPLFALSTGRNGSLACIKTPRFLCGQVRSFGEWWEDGGQGIEGTMDWRCSLINPSDSSHTQNKFPLRYCRKCFKTTWQMGLCSSICAFMEMTTDTRWNAYKLLMAAVRLGPPSDSTNNTKKST